MSTPLGISACCSHPLLLITIAAYQSKVQLARLKLICPVCEHIGRQGRESEWIFGSEEGQWQLAEQCSCKRLIVVSLGRGHIFGSSQEVQSEVSALVWRLAPSTVRVVEKGVPIMTCQDGVGKRSLIASETSPLSG